MSTTLVRAPDQAADATGKGRGQAAMLVGAAVAVALLVITAAVTASVVADRTDAESRIQHHRGLAFAAMPQLDRALQSALSTPLEDRPASPTAWADGPQLGPGQQDVVSQGAPTIRTILVRSAPDAVIAKMVVRSDGYTSTLISKWSDGGSSSDACSWSDLPPPWSGANSAATCRDLITSVPATTG